MSDPEEDVIVESSETDDVEEIEGAVRLAVKASDADVAWALVGAAVTQGDAYMNTSAVGGILSKSGASVSQSLVGDVWTRGDVDTESSAVGWVGAVGKVTLERSAAVGTVAGSTEIRNSKVGFVLSGKTGISEDSKVLIDGRSAAILGLVFGGVMIAAFSALFGWGWWAWRRYEPRFSMPKVHLPHVDMPRLEWRR